MHLTTRLLLLSVVLWCLLHTLVTTAAAGMLGYPVPRLRPLHARIELGGDSFQETLDGLDNAKATSGRGLLTLAFGPTDWSEIYARFGMEEVDVGLGLGSRRFGAFQFYGGGVYHHTDITIRDKSLGTRTNLKSAIPGRMFLGTNIYPLVDFPGGEFVVNVEVRFVGETPQVTLGLQYSF